MDIEIMYKLTPPKERGDNNYHRRSVVVESYNHVDFLAQSKNEAEILGLFDINGGLIARIVKEDIICIKVKK